MSTVEADPGASESSGADQPESLRTRQKRLAREAILQAAADEIVERGVSEFSLQDVAARAGVSARTLYNYFENRDVLLLAISNLSDEIALDEGGSVAIPDLDELPDVAARMWQIWQGQGSIYTATSRIAASSSTSSETLTAKRDARTRQVRARVDDRWPDLDDETAEELALWLHAALGPVLWERMRQLGGLSAERAGRINAWILHRLIDALDRGERPASEA